MDLYLIKKTFKGSQDGRFTETFEKGTEHHLSEHLLSCIDPESVELIDADSDSDEPMTEELAIALARELLAGDKQPADELKPLVAALGGEYSNKEKAIEFLTEKVAEASAE